MLNQFRSCSHLYIWLTSDVIRQFEKNEKSGTRLGFGLQNSNFTASVDFHENSYKDVATGSSFMSYTLMLANFFMDQT